MTRRLRAGLRRPAVLLALVVLVLAAGAGVAVAEWQTSNTGTSTARGGAIAAPGNFVPAPPTCSGTTGSARVSWTAVTGAVNYPVEIATNAAFTAGRVTGTVTAPQVTVTQQNATAQSTLYLRARSVAGAWQSAFGPTVTFTIGPCAG